MHVLPWKLNKVTLHYELSWKSKQFSVWKVVLNLTPYWYKLT
jgi:hypothetical protein